MSLFLTVDASRCGVRRQSRAPRDGDAALAAGGAGPFGLLSCFPAFVTCCQPERGWAAPAPTVQRRSAPSQSGVASARGGLATALHRRCANLGCVRPSFPPTGCAIRHCCAVIASCFVVSSDIVQWSSVDRPSVGSFAVDLGGKAGPRHVDFTLISLPLYLASQMPRLVREHLEQHPPVACPPPSGGRTPACACTHADRAS